MERHKVKFPFPGTSLLILVLVFFNHSDPVRSTVTLNSNGGYKFTVAFEEGTPEPNNLDQFINSMRSVLQQFSEEMWRSTEEIFFIEIVDILYPSNWNMSPVVGVSLSITSVRSADVQVSNTLEVPEVKNPNSCGVPGEFMKIPLNIFSDQNTPLGISWKVLLTQWARFRWGVWQEHGYQEDSRFPNFFLYHEESEWKRTSCSNLEILGTYIDTDGDPCNATYPELPSPSCQFVPDEVGNEGVVSSLMSSSSNWLETVTQFCDAVTHDKTSPNPQNVFCNQRSVLEVIKETEDADEVTEPVVTVPLVQFNYFKGSSSPLLYILIDNGPVTIIPPESMSLVKSSLEDFFDAATIGIPPEVMGSLAFFPAGEATNSFVDRKVEWQSVVESADIFQTAIVQDISFNETEEVQEFTFAIEEVLEELRNVKHGAGAILLIVKVGRLKYAFENVPYEEEILARVTTSQVKIHAIELEENKLQPSRHLQNLIEATDGIHRVVTTQVELGPAFQSVFEAIRASTLEPILENSISKTIAQKFLRPNESIQLPIFVNSIADSVYFSVTTRHSISRISLDDAELTFSRKYEWNEIVDMTKRFVYYGTITQQLQNGEVSDFIFEYEDPDVEDEAFVSVTAKLAEPNNIKILPSVSAVNGQIDMLNQLPLVVFAEISENGVPLQGVEKVTAFLDLILDENETRQRWAVTLVDNGLSYPDVTTDDGIYSGYFIPDVSMTGNSQYKVTVEAYHSTTTVSQPLEEVDTFSERKLHRDVKTPIVRFSESIEMEEDVIISNADLLIPVPVNIYDLEYHAKDDYIVSLYWTSPSVLSSPQQKVTSYEIRYSNRIEMLLEDNFSSSTLLELPFEILNPGERQRVDIIGDETPLYYAIKSHYNDMESKVSNIIGVRAVPVEVITVPPPPPPAQVYSTGYEIVVGIDENTPPPSNVEEYLDKLWTTLDTFSEEMFRTTKSSFYISKAPIVIPRTWNANSVEFTVNSYDTANVRISSDIMIPRAENPNACGLPGSYIELPLNFFDNAEDLYGIPWKSLLHLWGRYRWGIWEEHGYNYSTRFPFSYKKPTEDTWMPTGCSNSELIGNYRDSTGSICENNGEYSPNVDCHFVVDEEITDATSSLMHFHWLIPSVLDFCDENTHDMETPSKQNIFCSHRSAWEVIQSSPEFNTGTVEMDTRPPLPKEILKTTDKPLFYLLLDGGHFTVPNNVMTTIKSNLVKLFQEDIGDETFAAIGTFSNVNGNVAVLAETVPWSPLSSSRQQFISAINAYKPISTSPQFGTALESALNNVAVLKHDPGVVICMLKTGTTSIFDKIPREEEVLANFLEHRIKFYAIELPNSPFRPGINLNTLTTFQITPADEYHLTIRDVSSLNQSEIFLNRIGNALNSTLWVNSHRYIFSGPINPNVNNTLQVFHPGITTLFFALTLPNNVDPQSVRISRSWGMSELTVNTRLDWDELNDVRRRDVYYGNFSVFEDVQKFLDLKTAFDCEDSSDPSKCIGYLVVHGELDLNSNEEINELNVHVTTSAHGDVLDLMEDMKSTTPFAIFAKITNAENRPVRNIAEVKATIHFEDPNIFYTVDLRDDGQGVPDTATSDGIYSAEFIPPVNGNCQISVSIQHRVDNSVADEGRNRNSKSDSPVYSQHELRTSFSEDFLCETGHCNSVTPKGSYQRVFQFNHQLVITNSASWTNRAVPAQTLDVNAWALDDYKVLISWTLPKIFNQEDGRAEACELYRAANIVDAANGVLELVATIPTGGERPGTTMEYTFQGDTDTVYYFTLFSLYQGSMSPRSNIVGVKTLVAERLTTPLPSPPTVPTVSSTESTTPDPDNDNDPSSSHNPTSSSTPSTTSEEDYQYWYERQEGYITLAVFGAIIIFFAIGVGVFVYFRKTKSTHSRLFDEN